MTLRRRPVHLVVPSVLRFSIAKGGTNHYRALALALRELGPTTCYELDAPATDADAAWAAPGVEILTFPSASELGAALRERTARDALVLKVVGALRLDDVEADVEIARIAAEARAAAVFVDPDAPARLPHLVGGAHYLGELLPSYAAVVLLAGGARAVHEYSALARVPVHHASPALTALALPEAPAEEAERDHDVLLTASASSAREAKVVAGLEDWGALRLALVGSWPEGAAVDGVSVHPPTDPLRLHRLARRSRFTINLLRADFSGYADTAAARVFEAAAAGSCLVTEPFPGLPNYLEPETECLVLERLDDVPRLCALDEPERSAVAARAQARVAADARAAAVALTDFLAGIAP